MSDEEIENEVPAEEAVAELVENLPSSESCNADLEKLFGLMEDEDAINVFVAKNGVVTVLDLMDGAGEDEEGVERLATGCALIMSAIQLLEDAPTLHRVCEVILKVFCRSEGMQLEPLARNLCCLVYSVVVLPHLRPYLAGQIEGHLISCLRLHCSSTPVQQYAVAALGALFRDSASQEALGTQEGAEALATTLLTTADQGVQTDCLCLLVHLLQQYAGLRNPVCQHIGEQLLIWAKENEDDLDRQIYIAGLLGILVQGAGADADATTRARQLESHRALQIISCLLQGGPLPAKLHRALLGAFGSISQGLADLHALCTRHDDLPYKLEVRTSSATGAGDGVFLMGHATAGTCLTIYPGEMQNADVWQSEVTSVGDAAYQVRSGSLLHKANAYLVQCASGHCVDGSEEAVGRVAQALGLSLPLGPHACGQKINHPPSGVQPNVFLMDIDIRNIEVPGLPCVLRQEDSSYGIAPTVMVLVALRDLNEEELWLDYHWDVQHAPEWFSPVEYSIAWPEDKVIGQEIPF